MPVHLGLHGVQRCFKLRFDTLGPLRRTSSVNVTSRYTWNTDWSGGPKTTELEIGEEEEEKNTPALRKANLKENKKDLGTFGESFTAETVRERATPGIQGEGVRSSGNARGTKMNADDDEWRAVHNG